MAAQPSPGPLLLRRPGHQFSLCYSCGLTPSGICHLSEASLTTLPEHTLPFILTLSAHPPPPQLISSPTAGMLCFGCSLLFSI